MIEIKTKADLTSALADAGENLFCVKASAPWCAPCRVMGETIKNEEKNYSNVIFAEVDVDEAEEDLVEELSVRNIPLLIFYKQGFQVGRNVGLLTSEGLKNKIEEMQEK